MRISRIQHRQSLRVSKAHLGECVDEYCQFRRLKHRRRPRIQVAQVQECALNATPPTSPGQLAKNFAARVEIQFPGRSNANELAGTNNLQFERHKYYGKDGAGPTASARVMAATRLWPGNGLVKKPTAPTLLAWACESGSS